MQIWRQNVVSFILNFEKYEPEKSIPENQNQCTQQTLKRKTKQMDLHFVSAITE